MQKEDTLFYSWWSPVFDGKIATGKNWVEASATAPVISILYGLNTNEESPLSNISFLNNLIIIF